nr:MAG TPA: C2H2 type zinc-finger protein [Caudoviricetes sp.]
MLLVQNNGPQYKCTQCIAKYPFLKAIVRTNNHQ